MPSQVENVVKLPPWPKYVKLVKRTSDYREWPWKLVYRDELFLTEHSLCKYQLYIVNFRMYMEKPRHWAGQALLLKDFFCYSHICLSLLDRMLILRINLENIWSDLYSYPSLIIFCDFVLMQYQYANVWSFCFIFVRISICNV